MAGRIYLLNEQSELTAMEESAYESEKIIQRLLGNHPDLLAGDQIDSREPRRWLLVTREMGVPGEEDGANRWSLDHLFLDQDAVPTLVEVKRSTDTRIRREVVGQMLDYAANAVAYWPVEENQGQNGDMMEPMASADEWEWLQPRPRDWRPQVGQDGDRVTVTFLTFSGLGQEAIYRYTDVYTVVSYKFEANRQDVARGGGGFVY